MPQDGDLEDIHVAAEDNSHSDLPNPRDTSPPGPAPTASQGQNPQGAQSGGTTAGEPGAPTHPAAVGTSSSAAAGAAETPEMGGDDGPLAFRARDTHGVLHEFNTEDEAALSKDVNETVTHLIDLLRVRPATTCLDSTVLNPYIPFRALFDLPQTSHQHSLIKNAVFRHLRSQREAAEETARQLEDTRRQIEALQKERDDQQKALDSAIEANTSLTEANSQLTRDLKSKIYISYFLIELN